MALHKINDFDPGYRNTPDGAALQNFDVYSDRNEKIGTVADALVDQAGNFRYLVVTLSNWATGKQVLVPLGRSRVNAAARRIHIQSFTRAQAENLPAYRSDTPVEPHQEEQVRTVYRMRQIEDVAPLESLTPLEAPRMVRIPVQPVQPVAPVTPTTDYDYQSDPELYAVNDRDHQPFTRRQERAPDRTPAPASMNDRIPPPPPPTPMVEDSSAVVQQETISLMEERLVVDMKKHKTGEVIIRKEIETEMIQIPVRREKLIVEQVGENPKQLAEIDLSQGDITEADVRAAIDAGQAQIVPPSDRSSPQP